MEELPDMGGDKFGEVIESMAVLSEKDLEMIAIFICMTLVGRKENAIGTIESPIVSIAYIANQEEFKRRADAIAHEGK